MKRRRSGRDHLSDIFYNTGDMRERTVDESFGFSREFTDTVNEAMMEEDRLAQKKVRELEDQNRQMQNPVQNQVQNPEQKPSQWPDSHQTCL